MKQGKDNRKRNRDAGQWSGISQLSFVEHSLCRLDPPSGPFIHQAEYAYFVAGKKRTAHPELHCGLGLKPEDEFYLWGVCGLVFSQSEPEIK